MSSEAEHCDDSQKAIGIHAKIDNLAKDVRLSLKESADKIHDLQLWKASVEGFFKGVKSTGDMIKLVWAAAGAAIAYGITLFI